MSTRITVHFEDGTEEEITMESFILIAFQKEKESDDPSVDGLMIKTFEFPESTGWGSMEAINTLGERMKRSISPGHQMVGQAVMNTIDQGREVLRKMAAEYEARQG